MDKTPISKSDLREIIMTESVQRGGYGIIDVGFTKPDGENWDCGFVWEMASNMDAGLSVMRPFVEGLRAKYRLSDA